MNKRGVQVKQFFTLQRHLAFIMSGAVMSSTNDDSDSIGSESSGSGLSDEISSSGDEISSVACVYSSSESSSPGTRQRRAYRRGLRDGRGYNENDYRQIPRRRRF